MAKIVMGVGCVHTPQLHTSAEQWNIRAEQDRLGKVPLVFEGQRYSYDALLKKRMKAGFSPNLDVAHGRSLLQRAYANIDELHDTYKRISPDVMVIFGNDQEEIFSDRLIPSLAVLGAESFENMPRTEVQKSRLAAGIDIADPGHLPPELTHFPGHAELARHLVVDLNKRDFDLAWSTRQPRVEDEVSKMSGMPHAYGFLYQQLMRDEVIPSVPLVMNTFFPPNQPSAKRCLEFGRAIGRAIRDWDSDASICIAASGGLSHFVVDEEWDADIIKGLLEGDLDRLTTYHEGHFQTGNSEVKSWIAAAGALEETGLKPRLLDYFPLYRTEAGTGSSCAFIEWV